MYTVRLYVIIESYYQTNFIILFQPLPVESNTKIEFKDKTVGTNVPKNYIPSIETVSIVIFILCLLMKYREISAR